MWQKLWKQRKIPSNDRVILAAHIIHRNLDGTEDKWIAAMIHEGFEVDEAHRFAAFMPMAFSRPVMERLGVGHFVETASVGPIDSVFFEIDLNIQPEYTASLRVARIQTELEILPRAVFKDIASTSAEVDVANRVYNSGETLKGSTLAASVGALYAPHVVR
jgi:hypothetical protein